MENGGKNNYTIAYAVVCVNTSNTDFYIDAVFLNEKDAKDYCSIQNSNNSTFYYNVEETKIINKF